MNTSVRLCLGLAAITLGFAAVTATDTQFGVVKGPQLTETVNNGKNDLSRQYRHVREIALDYREDSDPALDYREDSDPTLDYREDSDPGSDDTDVPGLSDAQLQDNLVKVRRGAGTAAIVVHGVQGIIAGINQFSSTYETKSFACYWNDWRTRASRSYAEGTGSAGWFSQVRTSFWISNGRWYCCMKHGYIKG